MSLKTSSDHDLKQDLNMVYLDYNASTPIHPEVLKDLPQFFSCFGNPSSIHWAGRKSRSVLRESRDHLARLLNVNPLEIIFTSGASESNTTVLNQVLEKMKLGKNELIISEIEHPSIHATVEDLQTRGVIVHRIGVDRQGRFDWSHYERVLGPKTALVSVMYANNETGLVLPLQEIIEKAHQAGALVHTDAVQALGKVKLDLQKLRVDFASFSGHKFYASKGTGLLFCRKGVEFLPLILGGGQERKRRGGTENLLGIWSLGRMAELVQQNNLIEVESCRMENLRSFLEKQILERIPQVKINHQHAERLSNTSSIIIDGIEGDTLLMGLDVKGFAVSTGSACSSGKNAPSQVLVKLGLSHSEAQSTLRISLGWMTTEQEIKHFVQTLVEVVSRLRSLSSVGRSLGVSL